MATTRSACGVTLVELLVVLAIVGVLASLAWPSYRQYVVRAHRSEAIEALLATAAEQERFLFHFGRYAEDFAGAAGSPGPGLPIGPESRGGRYRLALSLDPAGHYTASAQPVTGGGQELDRACAEFRIRADGLRTAFGADGRNSTEECWR